MIFHEFFFLKRDKKKVFHWVKDLCVWEYDAGGISLGITNSAATFLIQLLLAFRNKLLVRRWGSAS